MKPPQILPALILFFCVPATAGVSLGPELPVSERRYVALPDYLVGPGGGVATDGEKFFVVWSDFRYPSDVRLGIFGARVTATGDVLDVTGIRIADHLGKNTSIVLAWNGVEYVVIYSAWEFIAVFLNRDGEILEKRRLDIHVRDLSYLEALTWTGSELVLRWSVIPLRASAAKYWTYLDARGSVLRTTSEPPQIQEADGRTASIGTISLRGGMPHGFLYERGEFVKRIQIATVASIQNTPAVAWNGRVFAVAWKDGGANGSVRIGRLSESGEVLTGAGIVLTDHYAEYPAISSDGRDFVVVWIEGNQRVRALHYSASGIAGEPVAVGSSDGTALSHLQPGVAFDGSSYHVVWTACSPFDEIGVFARRLSRSGELLDPEPVQLSDQCAAGAAAVAAGASNALVAWQAGGKIFTRRLSTAGVPLDSGPTPIGESSGFALAVASSGDDFLVAWRNGGVKAAIVNPAGQLVTPPFVVIEKPTMSYYGQFSATWNGAHYVVAAAALGEAGERVHVVRVTRSGAVLDPVPILVSGEGDAAVPAIVSFAHRRSLLVYEREAQHPEDGGVFRLFSRFVIDSPRLRAVRR